MLPSSLRLFCFIPFATGLADMIHGVSLLVIAGAPIGALERDPVLNSQVAFWGAIWFGYGLILWRIAGRLRQEPALFRLLMAILLLSGIARLVCALVFGLPGTVLTGAMGLELIGAPSFLIWYRMVFDKMQSFP
jgi:hypothetical protein